MKKIFISLFIVLFVVCTFISCSSSPNTTDYVTLTLKAYDEIVPGRNNTAFHVRQSDEYISNYQLCKKGETTPIEISDVDGVESISVQVPKGFSMLSALTVNDVTFLFYPSEQGYDPSYCTFDFFFITALLNPSLPIFAKQSDGTQWVTFEDLHEPLEEDTTLYFTCYGFNI